MIPLGADYRVTCLMAAPIAPTPAEGTLAGIATRPGRTAGTSEMGYGPRDAARRMGRTLHKTPDNGAGSPGGALGPYLQPRQRKGRGAVATPHGQEGG